MNVIFQINGGIGKCILATSMLPEIKKTFPECQLILMSGYPEVFINNPHVDRSFAFGQAQYFYQDFIENKEFKVFTQEPYIETAYLLQNEHLSHTWSNMNNLPIPEDISPQLFITEREKNFYSQKFTTDKPILLLQTNGGAPQQEVKYSWARDIPSNIALSVIEEFKNKYSIIHLRREDQIGYENTFQVSDSIRAMFVLINMSEKRLLMDSFAQHAAAGLKKPSTVLWVANTPVVFGYDIHTNIQANPFTRKPELRNSYLQKFDILGNLSEFPYNSESEIFNVDEVIKSLK